jgi:hypothetical protein
MRALPLLPDATTDYSDSWVAAMCSQRLRRLTGLSLSLSIEKCETMAVRLQQREGS